MKNYINPSYKKCYFSNRLVHQALDFYNYLLSAEARFIWRKLGLRIIYKNGLASFNTLVSARHLGGRISYSFRDIDFFLDAKKNSFNQSNFRNDFHATFDTSTPTVLGYYLLVGFGQGSWLR
jgi:hypothetical protein